MSQSEKVVSEDLAAGLHRVIRKLKRKGPDGKTYEYEQSFHVKKAAPGDRYAQRKEHELPAASGPATQQSQVPDEEPQPADQIASDQAAAQSPQEQIQAPLPSRVSVKVLDLAWELGDGKDAEDPVPPEVRRRYDVNNKTARATNPLSMYVPANTVTAGEQMLWGVTEPELVGRLRTGRMTQFRVAGSSTGCMLVKIEGGDGYIHKGYLKIEGLNDPYLYDVWGDLYDAEQKEGGFARRAAAAYEIAKASGFDDIVPPTVLRHDEFGGLDAIMSDELIERKQRFEESISRVVGDQPDKIRRHLQGYAAVQFYVDGIHGIDGEKWFHELFEEPEGVENDALNRLFEVMPTERRMAILRAAVFDFILWTGDRTFGSIGWGGGINNRHAIVLRDNELSLPNPHGLVLLRSKYGQTYLDPPVEANAFPLLWSDPVMMVATRGGDQELRDYEEIAVTAVRHLRNDRSPELVRSLMEHQIPLLSIAGMLARVGMLWTHHQQLARNPFLVLDYFTALAESIDPTPIEAEFMEVEDYVNEVMSNVVGRTFDFSAEMRAEDKEEDASDQ
jgi:hypothetical protein